MRRKDKRRHAKFWPNALKDHSIMLELRQGNAVDSKSKQSREPDPKKIGRSDRNLPDRIKLVGSDQVSRAAQRHGLKAMKLIPHFGPPYFEFNCAKTGALVFRFSPQPNDCTFSVRGGGGLTMKSLRVRNIFEALKIVSARNDVVIQGKLEQEWKSPMRGWIHK
jgi:hypothetical protein